MNDRRTLPLFCLLLGASSALAEPANNRFANAVTVPGTFGQFTGSTIAAGNESGEPVQRGGGVWYKWTSPNSLGRLTLSVEVFEGAYYRRHVLDMFQDVNGSIYDVITLGGFFIGNQNIRSESGVASPNTTYYFRVSPERDSDRSPFVFTLNFSPIYRSAARFSTRSSVLRGKRRTIVARISSPTNVTGVSVASRGKGRARNVSYNRSNGVVRFTHVRRGAPPRGRRAQQRAKVTYTIRGTKAGQVSVRIGRTFRVR